jgi:diguanylate cyclase (GGDEF)-like protein
MERQSKMLEQLAREDGLTGLSNRRWLDIELNLEFERARRFDHPFSVAMIDLDNFKSVNDRFSHLVGDEVLRIAAKLLRTSCRDVDVVGRYGGEEFTLILIETTAAQGAKICAEILKQFREYPWTQVHPGLEKLTASVGVCDNNGKESPREMVATADELLYRAKKQGKDRVCNELA